MQIQIYTNTCTPCTQPVCHDKGSSWRQRSQPGSLRPGSHQGFPLAWTQGRVSPGGEQRISRPSFWFLCVCISIWGGEVCNVNFLVFLKNIPNLWVGVESGDEPLSFHRGSGSVETVVSLTRLPCVLQKNGCFGFHSIKILSCFNIFWDSRKNNLYICNKCWEEMWEIFIYL